MAPLLWALALRHLNRKLFAALWKDPRFNHGLLVGLMLLRFFLSAAFVMAVLVHLYSYRWGTIIGFLLILLSIAVFWKRIKHNFLHFERRFYANLHAVDRDKITVLDKRTKFLHLARLTVSADSRFVGKSLRTLDLRTRRGITIVSIQRGSRKINIPPFGRYPAAGRPDCGGGYGCRTEAFCRRSGGRTRCTYFRSGRSGDAAVFGKSFFGAGGDDRLAVRRDVRRRGDRDRDRTAGRDFRRAAGGWSVSVPTTWCGWRVPGNPCANCSAAIRRRVKKRVKAASRHGLFMRLGARLWLWGLPGGAVKGTRSESVNKMSANCPGPDGTVLCKSLYLYIANFVCGC